MSDGFGTVEPITHTPLLFFVEMTPTAKAIQEKEKQEQQAKQIADLVGAVNALTVQVQDLIAKVDTLTAQAETPKPKGK